MGHTSELDVFLTHHRQQLQSSGIPEQYWSTLHLKLSNQTFDAGNVVQLVKLDYEDTEREDHQPIWALQSLIDIEVGDPSHIYLIDHAWTYRLENARKDLLEHESLRQRLAAMLGITLEEKHTEQIVDLILDKMWKLNNFYSIKNVDDSTENSLPVWYIMDEIGSAIFHDGNYPNCRIVPFVHISDQLTYSLLFPIENIEEGDLLRRNFAEGITDETKRKAALLPWVPDEEFFQQFSTRPDIPGSDYYLSGHIEESLPDLSKLKEIPSNRNKFKVFSQYSLINEYLTNPQFELTDNEEDADILWHIKHFKNYKELSNCPNKLINQFPFEFVLTVKDLLCLTCRRYKNGQVPAKWLPITYNLVTEIGNFIRYFQDRKKQSLENIWIIKPYNLARGLDMHITDNLDYIMRLPATGPKIAQKYITHPVLFYRPELPGKVKFDLRYVILLKSVDPLTVYVYKNFFLRFANKPFRLGNFDDYETHFTVMNYKKETELKHMLCQDFKDQWEQQYPNHDWLKVELSILEMLREVMQCAVQEPPPCGIAHNPQSRALYAVDLMLEWDDTVIQPKILEINFTPDCKRACEYYVDFFNDIFETLFLDTQKEDKFYKISC